MKQAKEDIAGIRKKMWTIMRKKTYGKINGHHYDEVTK
jgi:hypothetical protein